MSKKGVWLRRGIYGVGILVVVLLAAYFGGRWYVQRAADRKLRSRLGAAGYADMERFLDTPVTIDPQWLRMPVFSSELVKAASEVRTQCVYSATGAGGGCGDNFFELIKELDAGEALPETAWQNIHRIVQAHAGCVESVSACVACPDYSTEVFFGRVNWGGPTSFAAEWTVLQAYWLAHLANWHEAFATALCRLKLAIHLPAVNTVEHGLALEDETGASRALLRLAPRCPDRDVLRAALEEMNRLDPVLHQVEPPSSVIDEIAWTLRRNWASAAELPQPRLGREWVRLSWQAMLTGVWAGQAEYPSPNPTDPHLGQLAPLDLRDRIRLLSWLVSGSGVSADDLQRNLTFMAVVAEYAFHEDRDRIFLWAAVLGVPSHTDELLYSSVVLGASGGPDPGRRNAAKAQFDLARLALAVRIRQLEGKPLPTSTAELVPEFFSQDLRDPFSGLPYLWDQSAGAFRAHDVADSSVDKSAALEGVANE